MTPYTDQLVKFFTPMANPANSEPMARYLRDQFPFLGIKTPQRRSLVREFVAAHGKPAPEIWREVVRELWGLPEREYQYIAMDLMHRLRRDLDTADFALAETLITTKSWWDTIDWLATHLVGDLYKKFPHEGRRSIAVWRSSPNFWLRRTCLLFQLHYKKETDVPLLFDIICENQADSEFFIRKAIGWALREYSKQDAEAVVAFVSQNELSPLSQREALKWLKNKGRL